MVGVILKIVDIYEKLTKKKIWNVNIFPRMKNGGIYYGARA